MGLLESRSSQLSDCALEVGRELVGNEDVDKNTVLTAPNADFGRWPHLKREGTRLSAINVFNETIDAFPELDSAVSSTPCCLYKPI